MSDGEGKPSYEVFVHSPKYRSQRKRELLAYIQKSQREGKNQPDGLAVDMLSGLFSWKWGISERKIGDYVRELLNRGAVTCRGDQMKISDMEGQFLSMNLASMEV